MPKYATKQRSALLQYLADHADEKLSAAQIALALSEENISRSAVYRNLAELEAEGKVSRVTQGGCRESYYRYTDADACRECLHLTCTRCGRTYHMADLDADMLVRSLIRNEGFRVDKASTVLYGTCAACRE